MKNNKTTQIALLILVLFIWGTLAYRFFTFRQNSIYQLPIVSKQKTLFSSQKQKSIPFTIQVDYPDPFLGRNTRKKEVQTSDKSKQKIRTKKNLKPLPKIVYQGYSVNGNQVSRVRMIIGGKLYTLKKMEEAEGLQLLSMNRDSVEMQYGNDKIVVRRRK